MKKLLIISVIVLIVSGLTVYQFVFNHVRTVTLSKKQYDWAETPLSVSANHYFWDQFHQGNYDSIPLILEKLTVAYLDNPNDIRTVTHLGFTHMWAISEHQNTNHARIIDHATLAQKYFGESYLMNPSDTRMLSFLSSSKLVNGSISKDNNLLKDGYLNGLKSIREWKSFGAFSLAYTLSRLPYTDDKFKKALKLMKSLAEGYARNFDPGSVVTQETISRMKTLEYTHKSKDRVFYNSWVAPHNIEGFFMVYGDMLVKNGNWEEALDVYKLARHSEQYETWDFKDVLESKIENAKTNVDLFRKEIIRGEKPAIDKAMLIYSEISCRSCHQMSQQDYSRFFSKTDKNKLLDKRFYMLEK